MAKRPQVLGRFMKAMAESAKIAHTERDYTAKVLGKYLRIQDRKILEASYDAEIKALEPRLVMRLEGLKANLDEIAPTDPRARSVKSEDMVDTTISRRDDQDRLFRSTLGETLSNGSIKVPTPGRTALCGGSATLHGAMQP